MTQDYHYRQKVVDISKRLSQKGVLSTFEGNISVIDRKTGRIYITPSGQSKELLTPEMIVVMDTEARDIERMEGLKSSSEGAMHAKLYALRPDINACIHCHAPFCTAFAVNQMPIRTDSLAETRLIFHGEIPVLAFGELGTAHIIDDYVHYLDKDVFLLANHGMVGIGKDLENAYGKTMAAELVAKTLFISRLMGTNVPIPTEELNKLDKWSDNQAKRI